jgi:hypothetical protein
VFTSLNKKLHVQPIKLGKFILQLKKKFILQVLRSSMLKNRTLRRSKLEFLRSTKNANLFLSKPVYAIKNYLLKKKKPVSIINKFARFSSQPKQKSFFKKKVSNRKQRR